MKKLPLVLSLSLVFALLLGACGAADNEQNENGTTAPMTEIAPGVEATEPSVLPTEVVTVTEPPVVETAAPEATVVVTTTATMDRNPFLVSDLLGYPVATADNTSLGEVQSVVVDRATGQINYLLVDPNADLDLNDGLVAIPWGALAYNQPTADIKLGNYVFNLDRDIFVQAPMIALNDTLDFNNDTWDDDVVAYWSNQVATLPVTGATGENTGSVRIDDSTDRQLLDQAGVDIGDVEDMVIDPTQGKISYIVWAAGGFLDLGEKLILVPFDHLVWDQMHDNAFVLNVDPALIKTAPVFDRLDDLDFTLPDWDAQIREFWTNLTQ